MVPRNLLQCGALVLALLILPQFSVAASSSEGDAASKILVLDGSIVHDVGQLGLNITNFGLIGSQPSANTSFSDAPSAEWPLGSDVQHLFSSGLWVGAIVNGEARVSVGDYARELLPNPDDPLDTLYSQSSGQRYPSPLSDDDADGTEDEDPINGLDDDGDGQIDEDAGGIANQHFRAVLRDDTELASQLFPDHQPLGLEVVQESFQWSRPTVDDFVGFRFTITNDGNDLLEGVYVGFFADPDIGLRGGASIYDDDSVDSFQGDIALPDGSSVPVELAIAFDADGDAGNAPGWFGVQLMGHSTGGNAPPAVGLSARQFYQGNLPFEQGGDPVNDAQRYLALSNGEFDVPPATPGDVRMLVSVGPFTSLAPGEQVVLELALVVGEGMQGLIDNATNAAVAYRGAHFDRDNDPSTGVDGREFHVPWYVGPETPVSVVFGDLRAESRADGVSLSATSAAELSDLAIVRSGEGSIVERRWVAREQPTWRHLGDKIAFDVVDDEAGEGERVYELVATSGGESLVLDRVALPGLASAALALEAFPSPFNPRLTVRMSLPASGEVQLSLHDARGRLVRHLLSEVRAAGSHDVVWDGMDDQGRAAASGVYFARVVQGGKVRTHRAVLVR